MSRPVQKSQSSNRRIIVDDPRYVIGQLDDLPAVRPYERDLPDISNDVRQQALETEKAIRNRVVPAQP